MKIAFGYKMRSGKDTSVNYLISKYGGEKISFSKPLYDILHYAQKVCNFPIEKDRKFLQWIGTDWAREKDNNIWINLAINNIKNIDGNVYCSDVRFINEFKSLKENGFIVIKIERNLTFTNKSSTNHISENDLDKIENSEWDYVIKNDGTLKELYRQIDDIVLNIF